MRPTITSSSRELRGEHVALRPLSPGDALDLASVPDDESWRVLLRPPVGPGTSPSAWLANALGGVERGDEACWTIRDAVDGQLLGATRFLNIDHHNARLEIGSTWLLPHARSTAANPESKLLLLDHAFGDLQMRRVHIQADVRNVRSRRAIESLGATFEGVLRRHIILQDGTSRDTAVYSIVSDEWPALRDRVVARVAARGASWREFSTEALSA